MSDWKCCGQMSDCYQCEQGPKPEAPKRVAIEAPPGEWQDAAPIGGGSLQPTSDLERGLLKALEECVEAEAPTEFRKANPGLSDSELATKYATQPPKDSAREWWLREDVPVGNQPCTLDEIYHHDPSPIQAIRVIEYAAFEKMQRERDEARAIAMNESLVLTRERDELMKKMADLRASMRSWEVETEIQILANSDRQWNTLLKERDEYHDKFLEEQRWKFDLQAALDAKERECEALRTATPTMMFTDKLQRELIEERSRSAALLAALEAIRAGRFVDFSDAESIAAKALAKYKGGE